eukprot:TRINITY_DN3611_c0_g1_i3.p1 TRINITY_DN3611_c0_g1~~TRINITY_DN3611_c0_g1_i3.p1  ORF type:complete len:150 (-),score=17.79 TRINITY_DN3611_c0_g1_i3:136-585(-)
MCIRDRRRKKKKLTEVQWVKPINSGKTPSSQNCNSSFRSSLLSHLSSNQKPPIQNPLPSNNSHFSLIQRQQQQQDGSLLFEILGQNPGNLSAFFSQQQQQLQQQQYNELPSTNYLLWDSKLSLQSAQNQQNSAVDPINDQFNLPKPQQY